MEDWPMMWVDILMIRERTDCWCRGTNWWCGREWLMIWGMTAHWCGKELTIDVGNDLSLMGDQNLICEGLTVYVGDRLLMWGRTDHWCGKNWPLMWRDQSMMWWRTDHWCGGTDPWCGGTDCWCGRTNRWCGEGHTVDVGGLNDDVGEPTNDMWKYWLLIWGRTDSWCYGTEPWCGWTNLWWEEILTIDIGRNDHW